jgi:dTDP-4-amino-4,6-dideoxygalactose transaminase
MLKDLPGVRLLAMNLEEIIPHILPVRVMDGRRDALREYLTGLGIETGIHYKPNHLLDFFRGGKVSLPVTERLYGELLSLPLHPALSEAEVEWICGLIADFLRQSEKEAAS